MAVPVCPVSLSLLSKILVGLLCFVGTDNHEKGHNKARETASMFGVATFLNQGQ